MDSPPRAIRLAGSGETGPLGEDPRSIPEMVLEAVDLALADAAIGHDAIDAVTTASVDLFDGLTASNIAVTEVVGAVMKPECRIAADGLAAVVHGACQIWSGAYDTVLVVAHAKASMAPNATLTEWALDPIHQQPLGMNFPIAAGLQANVLALADAQAERRWAELAADRRASGDGAMAPKLSAAEILASEPVASPLRQGMCAPLGDGACAVVLRAAGEGMDGPLLRGVGHDLEPHALGDRDLGHWSGLARALDRACAMADLTPEDADFDLAEPSCLYPHEEELFLAAAGLPDGALVSPDGGLMAGCVPVVAGLSRLAAAARWLRLAGNEGKRALAHGSWGPAGQGQVVAVLDGAGQ
jgi:acetyl-CoA acetyltransferase